MENLKDVVSLVMLGVVVICLTISLIVSLLISNKKDEKIEELRETIEEYARNEARIMKEMNEIERNVSGVKEYKCNSRLERIKRIIA